MAPRKDATLPAPSAAQTQQDASSEGIEDFELPRMLVTQLAKSALPQDARLESDTVTALVKGSTVFINYLTSTAQDIAASRAHKTISGADVLKALEMLEFSEIVPKLQGDLEVFRQGAKAEKGKNKAAAAVASDAKGKSKDKPSTSSPLKSSTPADANQSVQNHHRATAVEEPIHNSVPPRPSTTPADTIQNAQEHHRAVGINSDGAGGGLVDEDVQMRDATAGEPPESAVKPAAFPERGAME